MPGDSGQRERLERSTVAVMMCMQGALCILQLTDLGWSAVPKERLIIASLTFIGTTLVLMFTNTNIRLQRQSVKTDDQD